MSPSNLVECLSECTVTNRSWLERKRDGLTVLCIPNGTQRAKHDKEKKIINKQIYEYKPRWAIGNNNPTQNAYRAYDGVHTNHADSSAKFKSLLNKN